MRRSIAATAKAAGIDDVSKLPGRAKIGYPSAEERIKLLGPNVYLGYRMGSVETHGDWNDLYRNHLTFEDGEFAPNLGGHEARPQVPLGLVRLTMMVMLKNLDYLVLDRETVRYFRPLLEGLVRRVGEVDDLHEHFLAS